MIVMPAPRAFITTRDISGFLGVCEDEARAIMRMFEQSCKIVKRGKFRAVDARVFARYLSEQDGEDVAQRVKDIKDYLREAG